MNRWIDVYKWMNEWANERTNEWTNEWKNEYTNEWTNERMIERPRLLQRSVGLCYVGPLDNRSMYALNRNIRSELSLSCGWDGRGYILDMWLDYYIYFKSKGFRIKQ